MSVKVILVGETIPGSRTPQRKQAFEDLGYAVTMVATNLEGATYEDRPSLLNRLRYRLRVPDDPAGANEALVRAANDGCDVVWVENARSIRAESLAAVKAKSPLAKLIWYSEDDTMNPRHRTVWMEKAMGLYDLWVTTKSFNAAPHEVPSLGVKQVHFAHNSYDPHSHHPVELTDKDRVTFGADVSFVGTYEEPRARSMLRLAEAGIVVRVWGNGWGAIVGQHENLKIEDRPVYGADFAKVVCASKVNLCFLRKFNRDLQTCRSMEIPAFGGFMLHERNTEIVSVFAEDKEAAYFADDEDLVQVCRRWLDDDKGRVVVAQAGLKKAVEGGHSHAESLSRTLSELGITP